MSGEGRMLSNPEFRRKTVNGYDLLNVIGEGEFGKVVKAKNSQGLLFAIKIIPKSSIARNPMLQSSLSTETSILLKLNHPNIIEFVEEFEEEENLCIVYEYCDRGNLRAYTHAHGALSERASVYVFKEILSALAELERCAIIHRDLKPENILLKDTKVKLADFGLSSEAGAKHNSLVGSPMFMAPEAMKNYEYTIKGDIYSLGVTLFKTVTGKYPFYNDLYETLLNLKYEFQESSIPRELNPQIRNLIWRCLQVDPNNRPSIHELLAYIKAHFGELDGISIEEDMRRKRGVGRGTSANRGHSLALHTNHTKQAPWARAPQFALNESFQADTTSRKALNTSVQENYSSIKASNLGTSGRGTNNPYAPLNALRDQGPFNRDDDRGRNRPYQPSHKPSNSLIARDNPLLKPYEGINHDQSYLPEPISAQQNPPPSQMRNIHVQLPDDDHRMVSQPDEGYNQHHMIQPTGSNQNGFSSQMPQQQILPQSQPQFNPQLNLSVMNFELERVNTQERYLNTQAPQTLGPILKRGYNPLLHQADNQNRRGSNPTQMQQRNYGGIVPQQILQPQNMLSTAQIEIHNQLPHSPNRGSKPLQIRGTPALGRQTITQNFASGQHHLFKEYATSDDQAFHQRTFGQDTNRFQVVFEQKPAHQAEQMPNYNQNYGGQLQLQPTIQSQPQYFIPSNPQPMNLSPTPQQFQHAPRPLAFLERDTPMQTGSGSPYTGSFINNNPALAPTPQRLNLAQPTQFNTYQAPMQHLQQPQPSAGFATRDEGSTSSTKGYKHPLMGNYFSNQSSVYQTSPGPMWGG